jgi:hypothetical protein
MSENSWLAALVAISLVPACGPGHRNPGDDDGDDADGCTSVCSALGHQACVDGELGPPVPCEVGQICDPELGCTLCIPNDLYCVGTDEIWQCNEDGTSGMQVGTCEGDLVCHAGACQSPCEAAAGAPSNLGCDFWSVDLDNDSGIADTQYAVIVANNNDADAGVRVTKNIARVGDPLEEVEVLTAIVPAHGVARLDLPQREVDGSMGQNGPFVARTGSHTFVSSHAYHIVTNLPVVAYQFNPVIQVYSTDASTLIPVQALGTHYTVVGYPTANPCGPAGPIGPDIPDHTAITIVAVHDDTHVRVVPTHRIHASGGDSGVAIPETEPGQPVELTIDRYDVANLESWQPVMELFQCFPIGLQYKGDLTGTIVESDKPVVVFTALERGFGFGDAQNVPASPGWDPMEDTLCCTEHFEEQLFPTTALGREFAIARSAIRSTNPSWVEPDIYRVVGTEPGTVVTTNLPAPHHQFTVGAGEHRDFPAQVGFSLSASAAVEVVKILVPNYYVTEGLIGDPSFALHPAAEQYRNDYVFLVPPTWQLNYMVLSRPATATILLDGEVLGNGESDGCYTGPIGTVAGVLYDQLTCPMLPGKHTLAGDQPFGLMVFGYNDVGAYSFAGGSDVRIINPIE